MAIIKHQRIVAAEEDDFDMDFDGPDDSLMRDDDGFNDQLDDIANNIEDLQDDLDEVEEDDASIEIDNNIDGHYIAECERCKGIFISAVSESDQVVESITGVCPLCDKETTQFLKWVVKSVD